MEKAVIDLPQPDPPHQAHHLPPAHAEGDPVHHPHRPVTPAPRISVTRSRTSSRGAHPKPGRAGRGRAGHLAGPASGG